MEAICLKLLQHFFSLLASASLLPIPLTLFGRKAASLVRLQPHLYNPAPVHSSPVRSRSSHVGEVASGVKPLRLIRETFSKSCSPKQVRWKPRGLCLAAALQSS